MDYGTNLRKLRIKSGHTQESLGFEIGVDTSTINRLENGKRKFNMELIDKMAKAMKKTSEEFLEEIKGITIHSSIQDNHGNGVNIENSLETVKELYEKILTEKERYIANLEGQIQFLRK